MKKLLLLAFMAIAIGIIIPSKVYAVDISVGATTWYSWWDPVSTSGGSSVEIDPAFLYGPALSVKFNDDFNLTFIFLYGEFDATMVADGDSSGGSTKVTSKRRDSDLALNYRLNNYFKLFGGIKYMGYKYSMDIFHSGYGWFNFKVDHSGFGPGLGISAAYPILDNLFFLASISGIYLWGDEEEKLPWAKEKTEFKEYGMNSSVSIAYYIAPASTVISLGGRFQYYKTAYGDHSGEDGDPDDDPVDEKNKFYGITLTATYNFSI